MVLRLLVSCSLLFSLPIFATQRVDENVIIHDLASGKEYPARVLRWMRTKEKDNSESATKSLLGFNPTVRSHYTYKESGLYERMGAESCFDEETAIEFIRMKDVQIEDQATSRVIRSKEGHAFLATFDCKTLGNQYSCILGRCHASAGATCGNFIMEEGEECDGTANCQNDCTLSSQGVSVLDSMPNIGRVSDIVMGDEFVYSVSSSSVVYQHDRETMLPIKSIDFRDHLWLRSIHYRAPFIYTMGLRDIVIYNTQTNEKKILPVQDSILGSSYSEIKARSKIYMIGRNTTSLHVLDPKTNEIERVIPVGRNFLGMEISPLEDKAYLFNPDTDVMITLDLESGEILNESQLPMESIDYGPAYLHYGPDSRLYVGVSTEGQDRVAVFSERGEFENWVVPDLDESFFLSEVVSTPQGYLLATNGYRYLVMSRTGRVLADLKDPGNGIATSTARIAYDPLYRRAYFVKFNHQTTGVIDLGPLSP